MTTLGIGIASYDEMTASTKAIARGKHKPKRGEPKVWFTSMESFARVLSDRNRELLDLMIERKLASIAELAELSGRAKSNLSRTLKWRSVRHCRFLDKLLRNSVRSGPRFESFLALPGLLKCGLGRGITASGSGSTSMTGGIGEALVGSGRSAIMRSSSRLVRPIEPSMLPARR
jgi:hypothetical protein